ncbi:MAG: hypothetical protein KGM91_18890 [Burkholderiales bacterium]|nr:hypothetical protein [Burkholderiales bacterium]
MNVSVSIAMARAEAIRAVNNALREALQCAPDGNATDRTEVVAAIQWAMNCDRLNGDNAVMAQIGLEACRLLIASQRADTETDRQLRRMRSAM